MSTSMQALPVNVDHGPGILAVSWIECALGTIFVVLRMYCRGRITRNVSWDDWTMCFTFLLALITTVFVTLEVHFGVGRHIEYLSQGHVVNAVKMIWMTQPFSTFSACFGKISIALLLMRIMNRNKIQEIILWVMVALLLFINLLCTVITFAQCKPVWQLWAGPHPNPSCWDPKIQQDVGYAQAAFSAFTDLVLAIFPFFVLRGLQMDLKLKISLIVLLGLGVFATASAVVKTVELKNLTSEDFTYNAVDLAYWFMTENWVIIIAACIPTLRPLFQRSGDRSAAGGRSGETAMFDKDYSGGSSHKSTDAKKSVSSEHYSASHSDVDRLVPLKIMKRHDFYAQSEGSFERV